MVIIDVDPDPSPPPEGRGRFLAIFDAVADGVIVLDPATGVVREANLAAGRMQGVPSSKLVGRGIADFIHKDSIEDVALALKRPPDFGGNFLVQHVRSDGSTFVAEWSSSALLGERQDGVVVLFRDLSTRIAAERVQRQRDSASLRAHDAHLAAGHDLAQALAVLEERQRLAHNLHDAVNQSLFSAGLIAEVLPQVWERDQTEARRSLQDLRRLMRSAQDEMRTLLAELRPSTLLDSDLGPLIRLLANGLTSRTSIPVSVSLSADMVLPAEVHEVYYRICQEALSNIAKHSRAKRVEIMLDQSGTAVVLRVRDDGVGFDHHQVALGRYGLTMMQERAAAVGASLSIHSRPGQGTEVELRWSRAPIERLA